MPLSLEGPRILLRRLRHVMAEDIDRQARLDRIVELIATSMNMAVCSVYLKSNPDTLELCATEGLRREAVHKTTLRIGEGLVGDIAKHARPLNLADAQNHPHFVYRPETGEEAFHSFVGVPVLRGGTVIGVLVVQNTTHRSFVDEEVEALQTVAMVLAEMLAESGQTQAAEDMVAAPRRFNGLGLADGLAIGHVVLHEPRVKVSQLIAEDVDAEYERLDKAVYDLRRAVDKMLLTEDVSHAGEHLDVLETYKMFANDTGWQARMREAVRTGLTAEAAVERVQSDTRARMTGRRDTYLRDRLHDFEDLSNRLLRILTGRPLTASSERLPKDAVLVARSMGPAELLDYERKHLRGLVIEEGTQSAHVSIVARALGIPTVGRTVDLSDMARDGQEIIVDADNGVCFLEPSDDMFEAYEERAKTLARKKKQYARVRKLPAITRDRISVDVKMNAGLLVDLKNLPDSGAMGIGLFRTELQFMVSASLPSREEQTAFYARILEEAGDKPVVFRTLDIGGDKMLPYMRRAQEENPAMGWRAIRIALDRPGLLRHQLRALLMAGSKQEISIMFPLLANVDEFIQAKALLDKELERLHHFGQPAPKEVAVGAMLEVPSLVWQLDMLLPLVDFICVGTNDLLQFFFASDRGNPMVGARYDILSPPALDMLSLIGDKCNEAQIPVTICGEAGGEPLEAMALLGLGFRSLSIQSSSIGPVKRMIRSLNMQKLSAKIAILKERNAKEGGGVLTRPLFTAIAAELKVKI